MYFIVLYFTLLSCHPGDDILIEDFDILCTIYDNEYYSTIKGNEVNKFQLLQSFMIADTIIHVVCACENDIIDRKYDQFILNQVRNNMLKLGFTEDTFDDNTEPNVYITVTAFSSKDAEYAWYPFWEWWYSGYTQAFSICNKDTDKYIFKNRIGLSIYDYYYPWDGIGSSASYSPGTILIEMIEVERIDINVEKIPAIWTGLINCILATWAPTSESILQTNIDQCFDQSPYLFKTK